MTGEPHSTPLVGNPSTMLLTVDEVAAELRLSRAAVYRMVATYAMPAPIKLGRSARWSRDVLRNWIADGCPSVA
ncbi:MAG: helix-turn-helix domain-containing protein [Planctomycetes bacterium]|nr:helix-turn-helix domain-containing protein [Planctomycetota bacterium]